MSENAKASTSDELADDDPSAVRRGFQRLPPKGVVLNIDGTLLDKSDAHARAWLEALAGEGTALPYATVRRQIGKGGERLLWELLRVQPDSLIGRAIKRHRREIFKTFYLPTLSPFPDTRVLFQRMRHEGMSLHVATSSDPAEVEALLRAAWVSDLVQRLIFEVDTARERPVLDIVAAAVGRSGLPMSDLMMLGDTPYDVSAGRAAGVQVVALRSGGFCDADLAGAIAIYDDPADLVRRWDASPFAGAQMVRAAG